MIKKCVVCEKEFERGARERRVTCSEDCLVAKERARRRESQRKSRASDPARHRSYDARYREKNHDLVLERQRLRREKARESINAKRREQYAESPDKFRDQRKASYKKHRAKHLERMKRWRDQNRDYVLSEHRRRYRENQNLMQQIGRANSQKRTAALQIVRQLEAKIGEALL